MRLVVTCSLVVVLGVATWAGVAFACGPSPTTPSLVWLHPTGTVAPASHVYVGCGETGANTATLGLTASNLGPGDACDFAATLDNNGQQGLTITTSLVESTPVGAPTFSTCFSLTVSSGPPSGWLPAGGTFLYTFTVGLLASAPSLCEKVSGKATVTFTGTVPCSDHGTSPPPWSLFLGPRANLANANLAGLDLDGRDMAGDNLAGANLSCDQLQGTDLAGSDLVGASLIGSDLTSACLQAADLQGAQLEESTLSGANFQGADLQNADLVGAVLTGFYGDPTNFDGANLQGINIAEVVASGQIVAVGATTSGTLNIASCVTTSGTATYCDEL